MNSSLYIAGYPNYQKPALLPHGVCSSVCPGSTTSPIYQTIEDNCGGPNAATVYSADWNPGFAPIAPLSWPWDVVTCALIDVTGEPFANPLVVTSPSNTPSWCTSYCAKAGYGELPVCLMLGSTQCLLVLAGVQNGNQCLCANSYTQLPFTDDPVSCFDVGPPPCSGNSSLACGAYGTRMIYQSLGPVPSSSILSGLPAGWTVLSWCSAPQSISSPIVNNAHKFTFSQNSPQYCSSYCAQIGYTMAVVQNGNECVCGSGGYAPPYYQPSYADVWDCNTPCPIGDATCGGSFMTHSLTGDSTLR